MKSGYEDNYRGLVYKLADCDFEEAAARLGFPTPVANVLTVPFLGRDYTIDVHGVEAADGKPSDPNNRSILIFYITSRGSGEPTRSYRLPHFFIETAMSSGNITWMHQPLVRKYGDSHQDLGQPLAKLGATYLGEGKHGEHTWTYDILPKIPVQLLYYAADEEFPCEIKILLDSGAGRFLEFEQLAFLCGCLIETLIHMGD